jgi:3-oxoacyl-[acyl-carrier-protein] synthase II
MRRAVITGLGAVTPVGNDVPTTWSNLVAGNSGVVEITRFDASEYPVSIAAEVKGFDPTQAMPAKEVRKTGPDVHYGVAAAMEAARDSGIGEIEPGRAGVIIGSAVGGLPQVLEQQKVLEERGRERVSPHWLPNMLVDTTTSHVATQLGWRGVNYAIVSACASGSHAIGDAAEVIKRGQADAILAGGTESAIVPLILAGFCSMRALADGGDNPAGASRPFDATRSGFVMSEGAAVVMVEELEHARARGARIYCEVAGYGASNDAFHVATPHPESIGVIEMMRAALESSGVQPDEVDYINAHGTSTEQGDIAETEAVKAVFGEQARKLVFGSTKSMTGHLLGGAGALEFGVSLLAATCGLIPPTINQFHPDPLCDLDSAPNRKVERRVDVALSNSFGFGGHNVTLAVKRWEE